MRAPSTSPSTVPDNACCLTTLASLFWQKDTTKTFVALLDNYEREVGVVEKATREEKEEMDDFMDALMTTPVMRFAFNWLRHHATDMRCKKRFRSESTHTLSMWSVVI
jgi:hypothetical protein